MNDENDRLSKNLSEELIEEPVVSKHVRVERIVSTGQSSPENYWYDQDENEWDIVLRDSAVLEFKGEPKQRRLLCGDWALIPLSEASYCFDCIGQADRLVGGVLRW